MKNNKKRTLIGLAEKEKSVGYLLEVLDKVYYFGPLENGSYNQQIVQSFFRYKCETTLNKHRLEIENYKKKLPEDEKKDAAIVVVGIHDYVGERIAKTLFTEEEIEKAENKLNYTLDTLASRDWILSVLMNIDLEMAKKLKEMKGVPVVIINYGVVNVYQA